MLPECRLLHEKLNEFDRIVGTEICLIILMQSVWISETIVTHSARLLNVNADCVRSFIQLWE